MNKANQVNTMEMRTKENQVIFFKSQEEFVKALRDGTGIGEEIGFADDLLEEE